MEKLIYLKKYLPTSNHNYFNGRPEGKDTRVSLQLDIKDEKKEKLTFFVNKGLVGMNVSFFLGLFSKTILKCGLEDFKNRYIFEYEDEDTKRLFEKDIEYGIKAALRETNPENLLDKLRGNSDKDRNS